LIAARQMRRKKRKREPRKIKGDILKTFGIFANLTHKLNNNFFCNFPIAKKMKSILKVSRRSTMPRQGLVVSTCSNSWTY